MWIKGYLGTEYNILVQLHSRMHDKCLDGGGRGDTLECVETHELMLDNLEGKNTFFVK